MRRRVTATRGNDGPSENDSAQVSGGVSKVGVGPSMIVIFSGGVVSYILRIIGPTATRVTRNSTEQVTLFKSCGLAVQDAAAAGAALREAERLNLGILVPFDQGSQSGE